MMTEIGTTSSSISCFFQQKLTSLIFVSLYLIAQTLPRCVPSLTLRAPCVFLLRGKKELQSKVLDHLLGAL